MAKELNYRNFIEIGSNAPVLIDELTSDERNFVGFLLNEQALTGLGYEPVEKSKYNAEQVKLEKALESSKLKMAN